MLTCLPSAALLRAAVYPYGGTLDPDARRAGGEHPIPSR
jgi:hypothetical protein